MNTQCYVKRLVSCGYSYANAIRVCGDFLKNFTLADLDDFVKSIEKDTFNVTTHEPLHAE